MNRLPDTQDNEINFIRAQPPFDSLSEAELQRVEQTVETVELSIGTHIFVQNGSPSRYLYLIRKGAVRLVSEGQVIQVLAQGEVFGYSSMLHKIASSYDTVAEENVLLYCVPEEVFHELVDNAAFALFFLKNLSERLHHSSRVVTTHLMGNLSTLIGDIPFSPPVILSPTATVAEAAGAMRKAWVDAALVTDEPVGIITNRDFLERVLAQGLGPETSVLKVMSQPVKVFTVETPVYAALLYMLEQNVHHLALAKEGRIVGLVNADTLLRHQTKNPLYLLRQLEHSEDPDKTLAKYALDIAHTVETLHKAGLDVVQIGRMVATFNGALVRRLLRSAEEEFGTPPTPYAWIVFGSEGRMEQLLLTDQDSALIYKEDTEEARKYFIALTNKVVNGLIRAGIPPCPGGYMATNWCKPFDDWLRLFRSWISTPDPQALLEASVFFDFRSVYGELSLEPLEQLLYATGEEGFFQAHMAKTALEFRPPLRFFRRIRDEAGQVDIKKGGVAPIVNITRFFALEAGMRKRTTIERLAAAAAAGKLSHEGAETLAETYRFLLNIRLKEQLAEIKAGQTPDNNINLQALSAWEKRRLKEAFMSIREIQEAISRRF